LSFAKSATADNGVTATYYDGIGRRTQQTDAESVSTAWFYDGLGRMTRQTEDVGGIARNTDRYYDQAGRMTRITDDLGQDTDYVSTAARRCTRLRWRARRRSWTF